MLPVVAGEAETHHQMFLYALSLIPVTVLLVAFNPQLGWTSLTLLIGLSVIFAYKVYQLKHVPVEGRTQKAWDVFGFSLLYLALFFVCLVVDSTVV
jgi:heme O synthase-like polyprenyltransferase